MYRFFSIQGNFKRVVENNFVTVAQKNSSMLLHIGKALTFMQKSNYISHFILTALPNAKLPHFCRTVSTSRTRRECLICILLEKYIDVCAGALGKRLSIKTYQTRKGEVMIELVSERRH